MLFVDTRLAPAVEAVRVALAGADPAGVGALVGSGGGRPRPDLCMLVSREAWLAVGGLNEGIRAGAQEDFVRRLREAGWRVLLAPALTVEVPRQSLRAGFRSGAGWRWLSRRLPSEGMEGPPQVSGLRGPAWRIATAAGSVFGDNRALRADREERGGRRVSYLVDAFPAKSETFVQNEIDELERLGWKVTVHSRARPVQADRAAARRISVEYVEDEPPLHKLWETLGLLVRHPFRAVRDARSRRVWGREEEAYPLTALARRARRLPGAPVHVHFAAGSALDALRIKALTGTSYSLIPHGFDIWQRPRNLREKLESARFVVANCDYVAGELNAVAPVAANRIERIVMGVDLERFRPSGAPPQPRTVVALGRYTEKKGFEFLVRAARVLADRAVEARIRIAGDGPLRPELEALRDELGLAGHVEFPRAWDDSVLGLLDGATVVVMPSVIAEDGDRDTMPVVVKEALAMQVPAVGSDLVGIPEMIEPGWGRLVPPGDPVTLADAIEEMLALSPEDRARMGEAGRAFVARSCNLGVETGRLSELLAS